MSAFARRLERAAKLASFKARVLSAPRYEPSLEERIFLAANVAAVHDARNRGLLTGPESMVAKRRASVVRAAMALRILRTSNHPRHMLAWSRVVREELAAARQYRRAARWVR